MGTIATALAAGTTVASTADISVASGATLTLGLFVAAGTVPQDAQATVLVKTPGAYKPAAILEGGNALPLQFAGPVTVQVRRDTAGAAGTSVGVYQET